MRARLAVARPALVAVVVGALLAGACSGSSGGNIASTTTTGVATSGTGSTTTTAPLAKGTLDAIDLTTTEVAKLDKPTALAARPSTPDLYIAQRGGVVRMVKVTKPTSGTGPLHYQLQSSPILDLSKEVLAGGEQGLLGLAFSSDGRKLYVDYTAKPDGRTRVLEYVLGDRATVDTSTRRELLEVDQPASNHNGGALVLGPDGYLYIGLGDGGGQGERRRENDGDRRHHRGSIEHGRRLEYAFSVVPVVPGEEGPAFVAEHLDASADEKQNDSRDGDEREQGERCRHQSQRIDTLPRSGRHQRFTMSHQ